MLQTDMDPRSSFFICLFDGGGNPGSLSILIAPVAGTDFVFKSQSTGKELKNYQSRHHVLYCPLQHQGVP